MIQEDYVSYEVAKLLKEKGFPQKYDVFHSMVYNEENYEDECEVQRMVLQTRTVKEGTLSSYPIGVPEPRCYCPTHQMAMKWLREVHKIVISIFPTIETDMIVREDYNYTIYKNRTTIYQNCSLTYEDTVEAALKYVLEKNLFDYDTRR